MNFYLKAGRFVLFLLLCGCFSHFKSFCQEPVKKYEPVKIGLLLPDSGSYAALRGAEMAIEKANSEGGFRGRPFRLCVRYLNGPWGTGSKQAVDLIFGEKVWALLASHDGRNAHLVEQAATKSEVVMISAWAGDPTLSQAFVPWFFNCSLNDNQQAQAISEELKDKDNRIAIVTDDSYDSKSSAKNLMPVLRKSSKEEPVLINADRQDFDISSARAVFLKNRINTIIITCDPNNTKLFTEYLKEVKQGVRVIATLQCINEDVLNQNILGQINNSVLIPADKWDQKLSATFADNFSRKYGYRPGLIACYSFDATGILLTAIKSAGGPDRKSIQNNIKNIDYDGITGRIRFDERGNRVVKPSLSELSSGLPLR